MAKYLDDNGLSYLWQKIKAHVNTAISAIGKVPTGGTAGQILAKASGTDYDTEWITNSGGSGDYLPITGGTLNGNLDANYIGVKNRLYVNSKSDDNTGQFYFNSASRNEPFLMLHGSSDGYGDAVVMGDGGMVVVGSGESAKSLYNDLVGGSAPEGTFTPGSEELFLASDSNVYIMPNCQTVGNRRTWFFGSNGHLVDKNYDLDISSATNGLSSNIDHVIGCGDKNNRWANYIDFWNKTDGSCNTLIMARKYLNGASVSNSVTMTVDKNGNCTTTFSNPAAWRKGLAACGVKTVTKTTGSFTSNHTTTTITAPASGWTCIGFVRCCSNGDVDTPYVDSWSQSGTTVTASIWRATTASITVTLTALFVNQSL